MATQTTNYGLIKPEKTDSILIDQINENMDKIDAALVNKVDKVQGKGLSTNDFTDADKNKLDGLENYDDAGVKADIAGVSSQAAINSSTLGYQGKNILQNTASTTTNAGIAFSVNSDGSVTATGTSTGVATLTVSSTLDVGSGEFKLSGCPTGGGSGAYELEIQTTTVLARDYGNGAVVNLQSGTMYTVKIIIRNGTTVNNLTFYPMLRHAEITDDTYEPYKPSVEERLNDITDQIFGLGTNIPSGANLNDYTEAGVYCCQSIKESQTLLNNPHKTSGFRLEVSYTVRIPDRFIQKIFLNDSSKGVFYFRTYDSNAYGSWFKFAGEAVGTT